MNELNILIGAENEIDFAPASLEREIMQNIRTIFSTSKYSVPLDREFGLNAVMLDEPQNLARALLMNEIAESIEKYEPRVKVTSIEFTGDNTGLTKPLIRFVIMQ